MNLRGLTTKAAIVFTLLWLMTGWITGFMGGRVWEASLDKGPAVVETKIVKEYMQVQAPAPDQTPLVDYVYKNSVLDRETATKLVRLTFDISDRPLLLLAFFQKESSFNPYATGDNGKSIGLGQIHKQNWAAIKTKLGLSSRELYDMRNNIKATNHLISAWLKETDGDIFKLCDRYNGGSNGMRYTKPLLTFYFRMRDLYETKKAKDSRPKHDKSIDNPLRSIVPN